MEDQGRPWKRLQLTTQNAWFFQAAVDANIRFPPDAWGTDGDEHLTEKEKAELDAVSIMPNEEDDWRAHLLNLEETFIDITSIFIKYL